MMASDSSGVDGTIEIGGRHGHAEIDPSDTLHAATHGGEVRQIGDDDFGAEIAQRPRAVILPPHKGTDVKPFGQEVRRHIAADRPNRARSASHKDRAASFLSIHSSLCPSVSDLLVRSH